MSSIYCLDTNVLIEPWTKYYSIDRCPQYWDILDDLAQEGVVFCTPEVQRELEKVDDDLLAWVKDRPYLIEETTEDVQRKLRKVLSQFQRLVDTTKDRSMADPWVIAHAMSKDAVVVTKEAVAGTNTPRIKIPDVCQKLGVPWMSDFDFLDEVGITFSASRS